MTLTAALHSPPEADPQSDRFELFYWSNMRGRWRTFGDFGPLRLTLERANEVFRNEPIFHSLVSR